MSAGGVIRKTHDLTRVVNARCKRSDAEGIFEGGVDAAAVNTAINAVVISDDLTRIVDGSEKRSTILRICSTGVIDYGEDPARV